jgi:hypothetical protein
MSGCADAAPPVGPEAADVQLTHILAAVVDDPNALAEAWPDPGPVFEDGAGADVLTGGGGNVAARTDVADTMPPSNDTDAAQSRNCF